MEAQLVRSQAHACQDGRGARYQPLAVGLPESTGVSGFERHQGAFGGISASASVSYSFSPESVKLLSDAVEAVADGVASVADTVIQVGELIVEGTKDSLETMVNGVDRLAKTAADVAADAASAAATAAADLGEAALSGATHIAGQALDAAEDIAEHAAQAAGEIKDTAVSLSRTGLQTATVGVDRAADAGAALLGKAASYALIAAIGAGGLLND